MLMKTRLLHSSIKWRTLRRHICYMCFLTTTRILGKSTESTNRATNVLLRGTDSDEGILTS